ncbi:MAG TPA: hypothetical protein RMH85_34655 [Polyangiaceae bacterium LLY-WYZ-15_(1-7)]|nr:hypothetical protein [Sandaracinus sp.]MBJ74600.1 hypothetical protein [Sandaracinus sp.]HJK90513.1 hypothetical protein [Polyangiaceae bacterium LLY-WYZ-15_(1-7)]HJL02934.1 hypothetical protein [Polyangiaceae bacterium LLY-WYZ-15_(1-7)]HJL13678.1 hypothetical protein [Polyangiaceae bacterium LLY-WYZ-15_(1-7)]
MRPAPLGWLLSAALLLSGCASAVPAWSGGSTTPKQRTDVALGGAARVPTGELRDLEGLPQRRAAQGGGVVPVGMLRRGLTRHLDVGLMVAGTDARLELRGELGVEEGSTRSAWVWAVAPQVGWIPEEDGSGSGTRFGLDLPFVRAMDFGGVYDVWFGLRVGAEGVTGDFALEEGGAAAGASAFGLRAGGLVGLAAGFRRVHAFLEVTVAYERWWGSHGERSLDRGGAVLLPAFGLRVRL